PPRPGGSRRPRGRSPPPPPRPAPPPIRPTSLAASWTAGPPPAGSACPVVRRFPRSWASSLLLGGPGLSGRAQARELRHAQGPARTLHIVISRGPRSRHVLTVPSGAASALLPRSARM